MRRLTTTMGLWLAVLVAVLAGAQAAIAQAPAPYAVGLRVVRFVDTSRRIKLPHGRTEPRTLVTYVRYPATGPSSATDLADAPPADDGGPFPLVVFAHGFNVGPATYTRILRAWAHAGYIVAAPAFPLESAGAPGGPDESDLVNEPTDIHVVISRLLRESATPGNPFAGTIAPDRVAVAGHSDGAVAALAAAYQRGVRDPRVAAAIIFAGAEFSPFDGFSLPAPASPALLSAQGTADPINNPKSTYSYWNQAPGPKYLLKLLGAGHLPPFTYAQPQLGVVERVSIAFLDRYLKGDAGGPSRMYAAARRGVASLRAVP